MYFVNKYHFGGKKFSRYINKEYSFEMNKNNFYMLKPGQYSSFYDHHLPLAHKKSDFQKFWELEHDFLDDMCQQKFRTPFDINHWTLRYLRLAEGNFIPLRSSKLGKYMELPGDIDEILDIINNRSKKMLCINDTENENSDEFEIHKKLLQEAFGRAFPEKCPFEL
jgi:hypothetical protein